MCAIFGSKDLQEFLELAEANTHRGSFSYSIMGFDESLNIIHLKKHGGGFDNKKAGEVFQDSAYVIGHIQAPTDGVANISNIHPAHHGCLYLYHNGMIKTQSMSNMKSYRPGIWDSELILKEIINSDNIEDALNPIDGSFACVLIDAVRKTLKIFTNNTCALYINYKTMSISSVKQANFRKVKPNVMYNFKPNCNEITKISNFNNLDDIYFMPENNKGNNNGK